MTDKQYYRARMIKEELVRLDKRIDVINIFLEDLVDDSEITINEYSAGRLNITYEEMKEIGLLLKGTLIKEIGLLEREFESL